MRFMSRALLLLLAVAGLATAQQAGLPPVTDGAAHGDAPYLIEDGWTPLLNGKDMTGWHGMDPAKPNAWFAAKSIFYEPYLSPTFLHGRPGGGDRIVNGPNGRTVNLVSDQKLGDVELYLEYMVAKGANSGVYLQGLYEVQVFDSFGALDPPTSSDGGGIYHRWINERPKGGSAPRVNACLPPGRWQSYQIWFRAPRFDASGKKVENAKFIRVLHNGILIQENVEVEGGTRASMTHAEAAENPLMLQGDHGPVAYRNIYWRPLRPIEER